MINRFPLQDHYFNKKLIELLFISVLDDGKDSTFSKIHYHRHA